MTAEQPLISTAADRRLAVEHWLLATLPNREARTKARAQWAEHGLAMLPLGGLMSAVHVPAALVQALARTLRPSDLDAFLAERLDGPVVCAMHGGWRYYLLVPGRTPITWREEATRWQKQQIGVLGRDAYLCVPPVDRTVYDAGTRDSYWSVPMASLGELCDPLVAGRFVADAVHAAAVLEGAAS
jgi:hypothetical protein